MKTPEVTLSVIIVNYNVVYFLEQCINSVLRSCQEISVEIIVVDNRSSDGSVQMVKEKFPKLSLIENYENVGFSKANNQAMQIAKGKYILLLNPDTVVEENTIEKIVTKMNSDDQIGGLGVRMVDGKGQFLPESKRGLPTPSVAFYKIFGLSSLFKKSKIFGKYHLTYLDENQVHEVDVLSGAFFCVRKSVLDKIGLLDETFFMYGEDIDLSYRIIQAGYKNIYFPETNIIHYKGESTKKSSVNYVLVFYKAMIIFAKKHFSQNNALLFSIAIHLGIYFRAGLAIANRLLRKIIPPIWSGLILITGLYALTYRWRMNDIAFPEIAFSTIIPLYFIIWTLVNILSGAFDEPFKIVKFAKSIGIGTLIILVFYALLPKEIQFSRLFIIIGGLWYFTWVILNKICMNWLMGNRNVWQPNAKKRFLIISDPSEFKRIKTLLIQNMSGIEYLNGIHIKEDYPESKGNLIDLTTKIDFLDYDEIIFSAKDVHAKEIIEWMTFIKAPHLDFKIAQPDTDFIIGSNSIETLGEMYKVNINDLSKPENLRSKRFFDLLLAGTLTLVSPILIWRFHSKKSFIKNLLTVWLGKKTWVGFFSSETGYLDPQLPRLKKGILNPLDIHTESQLEFADKFNLIYARDYSVFKDLNIIYKAFKKLDRESI